MKSARALWLLSYLILAPVAAPAVQEAAQPPVSPAAKAASEAVNQTAQPAQTAQTAQTAGGGEKSEVAGSTARGSEPAPPAAGRKVELQADTLSVDQKAEKYQAEGAVHLVEDGTSLLADSVIYNRLTGDALARGNVFMERAGDTLRGDYLSLNLNSRQGEVSNGELFIKKPNFRVSGAVMQKTGDEDYRIERGTFTTCDGPNPSWRFEARDVSVTLEEYATARDAVFYVRDVPILYTPYLIFPVKRERQSGLLIPKFGRSTKKGFFLDQPYYWAIDPSQDATFNLDIETSRGVGLGVDYRYMRARGSEGRLQVFGIYDTDVNTFRGELNQKHLELISDRTTLSSDIHLITERSYYREFGDITGEYNRQLLESNLSFARRWDRYGLTADARYSQDLIALNNDETLQRLPTISFIGAGQKMGPVFFSLDSSFTNFQRNVGLNGQRADLHPRLSYYRKPLETVELSVYAGYHQRLYNAYGKGASAGAETAAPSYDGVRSIGQADAGAVVSLPLERVYNGTLRHLVTPSLEYAYVQGRHDADLPFFDYGDRVLGQRIATWSVANVFTRKYVQEGADPEYRDVLFLKLSQGYQFGGQRRDLLTLVDEGHRFTDLMLESRYLPEKWLSLSVDGRYNPVDNNLSTGDIGVNVKGEGATEAALAYRFSRHEVEYLEARFAFPVVRRLSATVLGRYSLDSGRFLESRYALEYKQQCWSVIAAYADRPGSILIPANRQFTLNFTLSGIGPLGPVRAF